MKIKITRRVWDSLTAAEREALPRLAAKRNLSDIKRFFKDARAKFGSADYEILGYGLVSSRGKKFAHSGETRNWYELG